MFDFSNNLTIQQFKNFYKRHDPYMFWATVLTLIISLIVLILLVLFLAQLPKVIPLFYSLPWGESQLADTPQFLALPFSILLFLGINLVLSWHLHESQYVMKRVIALSTVISALLLFITGLKIILIFV